MTASIYESPAVNPEADAAVVSRLDDVVERVCSDLRGRVPRARVRQLAIELMARYGEPVVTAYIPIILRRQLLEQLRAELARGHDRLGVNDHEPTP